MRQIKNSIGLIATTLCLISLLGQAQDKTEKGTIKIDLAYHQLNDDFQFSGQPLCIFLGQFQIVIGKTDCAEPRHDQKSIPDKGVAEICP